MDGKNILWKQLVHRSDSLSVCSRGLEIRICFCDSVKPEFEGVVVTGRTVCGQTVRRQSCPLWLLLPASVSVL